MNPKGRVTSISHIAHQVRFRLKEPKPVLLAGVFTRRRRWHQHGIGVGRRGVPLLCHHLVKMRRAPLLCSSPPGARFVDGCQLACLGSNPLLPADIWGVGGGAGRFSVHRSGSFGDKLMTGRPCNFGSVDYVVCMRHA